MLKKIHRSWLQCVGPKSCSLQYVVKKKHTLWDGGAIVKDLLPQCGGEEFESHTCNLDYLGYLSDLIR
jgi:hypothetical protein